MDVSKAIVKRIEQSNGQQSAHSDCIICGQNFQYCAHTMTQTYLLLEAYKLKPYLDLLEGTK